MAPPENEGALTGYPVGPPAIRRPVTFDQTWDDVTFVHWPIPSDSVASLFPRGTRPDVFADGFTYVGLIPFTMRRTALGSSLPVPYLGTFHETNVRLYSVDEEGRHGVLFRSLETQRLAVVPTVRALLGIPYTWARMRVERTGDIIAYRSVRRLPDRGLRSRVAIRVGEPVVPTPLDVWLTARWGAHTRKAGRTWWLPNEHEPWPLRAAELIELRDELVPAAGVVIPAAEPRVLYSPGVQTRFGTPSRVC